MRRKASETETMFDLMERRPASALALVPIAVAALASPAHADPARAATPPVSAFDGQWVIDATTTSFLCPVRSKRLVAILHGGQVAKFSGLPGEASGRVGHNGDVTINLRVYGVTATVRGRLIGAAGAGDWSANSMLCARGDWRAHAGN
jgi:hypothetical protein